MKFSAREDIEAPIEAVFDSLCDFERIERQALRRGADVRRVDTMTSPGVGVSWDASFRLRGKQRDMRLTMDRFERPTELAVAAKSSGMDGMFVIELMSLSQTRTRMAVSLEMKPLNLSTRLLVQSLKLAKASLNKRFKLRVAEYANQMEQRLKGAA